MPFSLKQFRASWPATLAVLAVVAAGIALGLWQLSRAQEKSAVLEQIAERGARAPRTVEELLALPEPAHYPVRVRGQFDNTRNFLLDNRLLEGRAGYHLLSPFRTVNDHWVLVNRGWLPRGASRERLPAIPEIPGLVTVHGRSYVPSDRAMVLQEESLSAEQWPIRVQKVDIQAMQALLGVELAPFEIRVAPDHVLERDEQLPRVWHDSRLGPERHHAYALQWFGLAAAALVLFLVAGFRHGNENERKG